MSRDDAVRAAAEALASRMGPPVDQWPRYYAGLAEAAVDAAAPHLLADLVRERDEALAQSERDLADALIYKARWNEALADATLLRGQIADTVAVLSVAWPTTEVPWIAEVGVAACVSLLASQRDDALAEVERLRAAISRHSCSPRDALDMD